MLPQFHLSYLTTEAKKPAAPVSASALFGDDDSDDLFAPKKPVAPAVAVAAAKPVAAAPAAPAGNF
jgi:hypothetical protein